MENVSKKFQITNVTLGINSDGRLIYPGPSGSKYYFRRIYRAKFFNLSLIEKNLSCIDGYLVIIAN